VRARVPERVSSFVVVELEDLELAILLERARHIPEHAIDFGDERVVGQIFGDFARHVERSREPFLRLPHAAVREINFDRIRRKREALRLLLRLDSLEQLDALRNRRLKVGVVLGVSNHGGNGGGETVYRKTKKGRVRRSVTAQTD